MTSTEAVKEGLRIQHSQLNSPCKYTEMKAGFQMFFAVLIRFGFILMDTAKANKLNPYGSLKWFFETAPKLLPEEYSKLLPWNADSNEVNRFALNR